MALFENARPYDGWAASALDLLEKFNNLLRRPRHVHTLSETALKDIGVDALSDHDLRDIGLARSGIAEKLDRDLAALHGKGIGPLM